MPYSSFADQYHFTVMGIFILMQFIKIILILEMNLFITVDGTLLGEIIFDSTDGLIHSPRFLSLFTISFLSGCTVNKAVISPIAVTIQAGIVRYLPILIAIVSCIEQVLYRNFIYTFDDYLFMLIFCITI
jgi:hypothetical protein